MYRDHIIAFFALIILVFFCSPIFALAIGMAAAVAPSSLWLKMFVGMTNVDIFNALHTLMLPLIGAVIIFRADKLTGSWGAAFLFVICSSIIVGFIIYILLNPLILGDEARFVLYAEEYKDVHRSIFTIISMLSLLFLTKLGLAGSESSKAIGSAQGDNDKNLKALEDLRPEEKGSPAHATGEVQ